MACKDCITGSIHSGTPTGRVETLFGLPTCIAEPPQAQHGEDPKAIIVIIPDAFGWELPNSRILADEYAKKGGFKVLVPDFMDGHWMAHDLLDTMDVITDEQNSIFSKILPALRAVALFAPFMYYNRASIAAPRIYSFFRSLRTSNPTTSIGAAGFCWGGKYTVLLCSGDERTDAADGNRPLIDAGFTAHPSFLEIPKDVEAITLPLSIANGTKDIQLTPALLPLVEKVFEEKRQGGGGDQGGGAVPCELVIYEGAKHGFAVRGNPKDEEEKKRGKEAEGQAIRWFEKYLVGGKGET